MKRGVTKLVLVASLATACTAISGLDADYELARSNTFAADASAGEAGDATAQDSADPRIDATRSDGATCADSSCALKCGGVPCSSCREIKQAFPTAESGLHVIQGKAGPLTVHCEMSDPLANGGWTLVGRSTASGTSTAFGWHSSDGSPADDTKPYSLDVDRLAFVPTEMLFGSVSAGKAWGDNVYRVTLPANFVSANKSTAVPISLVSVKGVCGGGSMHSYAGYTSRTDVFFFRDNNSDSYVFGLFPHGWFANVGNSCSYASQINDTQGMLFVR